MNNSFEKELNKIENLKWLPWIGSNYNSAPKNKKILIIGESHYQDEANKYKQKDFTKLIIENHGIQGKKYSKIFQNLQKTLFNNLSIDRKAFWNSVAFYNFVQRAMKNVKERPSKDDFLSGWQTLFELIEVIKPNFCLFIGVGSSKVIKKTTSHVITFEKGLMINRTYPRILTLETRNMAMKYLFIKHTSRYFSWKKWNEYLVNEIPDELEWLKRQSQVII